MSDNRGVVDNWSFLIGLGSGIFIVSTILVWVVYFRDLYKR